VIVSLGVLTLESGCDRMITPRQAQLSKDADAKAAEGSYAEAINLYETALDGTPASAEVHYKLALIYDDKMNDPLNALHHFKRFLAFEPSGKRAQEVKGFMKRDELTLLTNLTGDSMVPRAEVVRLRNENLALRQQIGERWAAKKAASATEKAAAKTKTPNEKTKADGKSRRYTVERGDTLASISRKFYKTSGSWQKILEANSDVISKPGDLKPGQTLVIP
jgi:LysM repeat protein